MTPGIQVSVVNSYAACEARQIRCSGEASQVSSYLLGVRARQVCEQRGLADRGKADQRCVHKVREARQDQRVASHPPTLACPYFVTCARGGVVSPRVCGVANAHRRRFFDQVQHGALTSKPSPALEVVPGAGSSSSVRSFASCALRRPRWYEVACDEVRTGVSHCALPAAECCSTAPCSSACAPFQARSPSYAPGSPASARLISAAQDVHACGTVNLPWWPLVHPQAHAGVKLSAR